MRTPMLRTLPTAGPLALVGHVAALVSLWLIVTMPYAVSTAAGWRHELICSTLGLAAIFAGTWAQGRRWPQPAVVFAAVDLVLVWTALLAPVPRMPVLWLLAGAAAAGGAIAFAREVAVPAAAPLVAPVLLGLLDLALVTPFFIGSELSGALQPPL